MPAGIWGPKQVTGVIDPGYSQRLPATTIICQRENLDRERYRR
jgi:hypothetical protein